MSSKRFNRCVTSICFGLVLQSCSVPLSISPDEKNVIYLSFNVFGEANVVLEDRVSKKRADLFNITFQDDNERIQQFAWSVDGRWIAWLITNSNRYPHGKRLLVFQIVNSIEPPRKVLDITSNVKEFGFRNEGLWLRDRDNGISTIKLLPD